MTVSTIKPLCSNCGHCEHFQVLRTMTRVIWLPNTYKCSQFSFLSINTGTFLLIHEKDLWSYICINMTYLSKKKLIRNRKATFKLKIYIMYCTEL